MSLVLKARKCLQETDRGWSGWGSSGYHPSGCDEWTENKREGGLLLPGENAQRAPEQLLHLMSASKRVMFNVWMWWSQDALIWAGFYDYLWLDLFCLPTKHQLLQPACRTMFLLLALLLWGSLSATRLPLGAWLYPIPDLCMELGISQDLLGGLYRTKPTIFM